MMSFYRCHGVLTVVTVVQFRSSPRSVISLLRRTSEVLNPNVAWRAAHDSWRWRTDPRLSYSERGGRESSALQSAKSCGGTSSCYALLGHWNHRLNYVGICTLRSSGIDRGCHIVIGAAGSDACICIGR